jgi:hypothetical protein
MYKWAMLFRFRGDEVTCEHIRIREPQAKGESSAAAGNSQVWLISGSQKEIFSDPWLEPVFIPTKPSQSIN